MRLLLILAIALLGPSCIRLDVRDNVREQPPRLEQPKKPKKTRVIVEETD